MDNKNGSKKTHKTQSLARNLVVLSPKMNPALGEELQWIHEDFSTPHKSFDRINGFSLRDITWAEVQSLSDGMETFLTCYCFKTRISEERALKGLRHMCNIRSKFLLGKYGALKKRNSHLISSIPCNTTYISIFCYATRIYPKFFYTNANVVLR